ncbi:MAG TPA: hypothetical protein VGE75_05795, partial [Acidimicrobiales bacterium]
RHDSGDSQSDVASEVIIESRFALASWWAFTRWTPVRARVPVSSVPRRQGTHALVVARLGETR